MSTLAKGGEGGAADPCKYANVVYVECNKFSA